jgi:hypothetical protein
MKNGTQRKTYAKKTTTKKGSNSKVRTTRKPPSKRPPGRPRKNSDGREWITRYFSLPRESWDVLRELRDRLNALLDPRIQMTDSKLLEMWLGKVEEQIKAGTLDPVSWISPGDLDSLPEALRKEIEKIRQDKP